MVGVVEAETWGSAPAMEAPADEADGEPPIDEVLPDGDEDESEPICPRPSVVPEARHRRWATDWDEDAIWGDPDPVMRRRLKRLLGGSLK